MKRSYWAVADIELLIRLYPDTPTAEIAARLGFPLARVYSKAACLGLKKSAEYLAGPFGCRLRRGDNVGEAFRFKAGGTPWNAGKKGWQAGGRSVETQFKPGGKPHTWHPIGHERVTTEGYLQRKMTDTGVTRRDYINVHWLVWRDAGRVIPPGHALVFKDGNKKNTALENLELVTRAELMARNTVHRYPKEIASLVQLRGALIRKINNRSKKHDPQDNR